MSRVFKSCRTLLAPAKPASTAAKMVANEKGKPEVKPKRASSAAGTGKPKAVSLSPALREYLGIPEDSRDDSNRKIWSYIRKHYLQNPRNKAAISSDPKLKALLNRKK